MKKLTVLSIAITTTLMTQIVFAHGHGGNSGVGKHVQLSCEQLLNSPRHQARVAETLTYFDLNKDDQITQDEVQASHQARFTALDTDGNGYLSLTEFQLGAPGATTTTTTTQTMTRGGKGHRGGEHNMVANDAVMTKFQHARFTRLDTNSDGQISLAEFTVNLPAFDKFDSDGDGVVTKTDLLNGSCPTTTTTTTDTTTTTTTTTDTTTTPTVPVEEPAVVVEEPVLVEEPVVTDTTTTTTQSTTPVTQPTTTTNDHSGGLPCSNCH